MSTEVTNHYRVEVSSAGCETCGTGTQWAIVHDVEGDPCEIGGMTWGSREEVDAICELLNDAFECGQETYIATLPADWHADSSLEKWFPFSAEELSKLKSANMHKEPTSEQAATSHTESSL